MQLGRGGPFGAIIVRAGEVIATSHNQVLETNDPTAHAEVVAIREACSKLGRPFLYDCIIYSSCCPCPMCFSAIVWAKIPKCFYSSTPDDAAAVGFDDRYLYDVLQGKSVTEKCILIHHPHPDSNKPFNIFAEVLERNESTLY